ncbi:hypothetical protein, partial [Bacillus cereus]
QSRFLLSVKKENKAQFESLVKAQLIGETTNTSNLQIYADDRLVLDQKVVDLESAWKGAIPCLLK